MSDAAPVMDGSNSIFLSYSRHDRDQVLPIIDALEQAGYSVWWDGLLKGGERFLQVTENALETSDVVLVMWTRISVDSDWVRDEATRGRDSKRLLSVSLDGTEPPLGFRQVQYVDLSGTGNPALRSGFPRVLEALGNFGGGAATGVIPMAVAAPVSSPAGALSRRNMIVAGGVGILAAGGVFAVSQSGIFAGKDMSGSIAVLTFENLSADPEQAYFSAGLSEELRSILSLNPQLTVAAQTSTDKFSAGEQTAGAIASALGVANVLEGSVRRAGNRLRVAVRLIDGATDLEQWAEQFDRELDDVLVVQTEIATRVVDSLIANISGAGALATGRIGGTKSADALDAYMRGIDLYGRSGAVEETDREALAALDRAIEIDPDFGAAYAGRSQVLTAIGNRHATGEELKAYYDDAFAAAQRAIEIAPDLAASHYALGSILANGRLDMAAARLPFQRSFELGFGNARILLGYTLFASYIGDFANGRDAIERAERLDPLNAPVFRAEAVLEIAARDYTKAAEAARRALSLNKETSVVNGLLGDIARFAGRTDEARSFYELEPSPLFKLPNLAMLEHQAGNRPAAQREFDSMVDQFGDNSLYQQAQVLAQWGQSEAALVTLERAFEAGDAGLVLSHTDRNLDPIRQTARFQSLQQRLGFA